MSRMLLVRAGRGVWGVPEAAVRAIAGRRGSVRIDLRGTGPVPVSEVVARVEARVRALGPVTARLVAPGVVGFAAFGGGAVPVVDPESPPWAPARDGSGTRDNEGGNG